MAFATGLADSTVTSAAFTITPAGTVLLGNSSAGSAWDGITDGSGQYIDASRWQATASASAIAIRAYVKAVPGSYKCAIYADSGGGTPQPTTRLGSTAEVTNPPADGWRTFTLITPVSVTSGNYYWLAPWSNDTAAAIRTETSGGTVRWPNPATYTYAAGWPATLATNSQYNYLHSIYAESASPLSSFDQWKTGYGLAANVPASSDSDGDGISLFAEYSLALNPQQIGRASCRERV